MKHWSQYWNAVHSLSSFSEGSAAEGYEAEIKNFWIQASDGLEQEAVIVDIGTGNGALAVLFNDYGKEQKRQWQVHGVDAAVIAPQELEKRNSQLAGRFAGIEFHAETNMAAMPFADASVDCVVSQFAFEYGDEEATLKEIARILKPNGRFVMMGHHKKSLLHHSTETGLNVLQHTLHETPLFIQAELYLRLAAQALQQVDIATYQASQEGMATGKTVEWLLHYIQDKYQKADEKIWVTDISRRVINVISEVKNATQAAQGLRELNVQYQTLVGHALRLKDMTAAAKTETQMKKMVSTAKTVGLVGTHECIEIKGDVFAWAGSFVKA